MYHLSQFYPTYMYLDDGETTVFEVDWESAEWSPITRRLVNQSHSKPFIGRTIHVPF
jgi:hypothetical protein